MNIIRNKIKFILTVFLLLSIFTGVSLGEKVDIVGPISTPEVKYSYSKLANGLEIFVFEDHKVPLVEVSVWYKVGSVDEPEGITGISHLLEHMMFLGTNTLEKDQVHKLVKKVGGYNNASTHSSFTKYYQEVPATNLELGIAIEADRMRNLKLDPVEFAREKEVIMQERRRSIENDAIRSASEEIIATAFQQSPLHHQIIGWMQDLKRITVEDVNTFYRQYYAPNNAVLVVSGDAGPKVVQELAVRYFGDYQPQKIERINTEEPEQQAERMVTVERLINVPYIIMLYKLPSGNHPDMTAVEFMLEILSNKPTSRINTELKQKQEIILAAGAWANRLPIPGYAQVVLVPGEVDKIQAVTKGFDAELKKLIENGITDEELRVLKKAVLKELVFAQKDLINFKNTIITGHLYYNDPEYYQKEIKAINELTKEDIIRVAQRYFIKEKRTVGYIIPEKNRE